MKQVISNFKLWLIKKLNHPMVSIWRNELDTPELMKEILINTPEGVVKGCYSWIDGFFVIEHGTFKKVTCTTWTELK